MNALVDLARALVDGATRVPFLVWVALVVLAAAFVLTIAVASAEYTTFEQREQIARADRELRGTRGMPIKNAPIRNLPPGQRAMARGVPAPRAMGSSTRNSAPARRAIGEIAPSTRPTAADGLGPVWRVRPRRDHHT